jgi:putative ABC transport system substrate-binding protein
MTDRRAPTPSPGAGLCCTGALASIMRTIQRRQFITLLGGAVAYPWPSNAQHGTETIVGFLHFAADLPYVVEALRQGIKSASQPSLNLRIEPRWANGQYHRLPELAQTLVRLQPAAIVTGGLAASVAGRNATDTIPIVFASGGDPVRDGLVPSFSRPGGNVTGFTIISGELAPKRLELLRDLVPHVKLVAVLEYSGNPTLAEERQHLKAGAAALGIELLHLEASGAKAIDAAFATLLARGADAVFVSADANFYKHRQQLVALAARHRMPAIYHARDFVTSGGLISYGPEPTDIYRQVGGYVARIIQGAKPADLPVQQPTKFQLTINVRTGKALVLTVPPTMLARADELIE